MKDTQRVSIYVFNLLYSGNTQTGNGSSEAHSYVPHLQTPTQPKQASSKVNYKRAFGS